MNDLSAWLSQKKEEDARRPAATLYSLIYDERLWSYPFRRLLWPVITASWKAAVGYLIWRQVGEDLPLFSWGELFTWIQIVYLTEFLVSALLESARAELRSSFRPAGQVYSHREKRYFVWANLVSVIPLLYFLLTLGRDLTYSGRYFGFYDALTLIFLARLWLSTTLRFEIGLFAFARRTRLYIWNWIAPSLVFLVVYFSLREALGPWALVLGLSIETSLQLSLSIVRRLKIEPELSSRSLFSRYRAMLFGLKFRTLKEFRRIAPSVLKRLVFLPVFGWMHFYTIYLFQSGELDLSESILIHSISPLISLLVRSGVLYWKDLIDCAGRDLFSAAVNRRIYFFGIGTSLVVQFVAILAQQESWISEPVALYFRWAALTELTLVYSLEPWLGKALRPSHLAPLLLQLGLFFTPAADSIAFLGATLALIALHAWLARSRNSTYTHVATLRKTFWSTAILLRAEPELIRLGIPYEMKNGMIYVSLQSDVLRDLFLNWGRGWILTLKPAANRSAPESGLVMEPSEYAQFDITKLKWLGGRPELRNTSALSLDERSSLMKTIHSGLSRGMIRGTGQLATLRMNWKSDSSTLFIRVRPRG